MKIGNVHHRIITQNSVRYYLDYSLKYHFLSLTGKTNAFTNFKDKFLFKRQHLLPFLFSLHDLVFHNSSDREKRAAFSRVSHLEILRS